MRDAITEWESEGGAAAEAQSLSGTHSQIYWASYIRSQVEAEFDRVVNAFSAAATRQTGQKRLDTECIIEILKDLRDDVMARSQAGYFIHDWHNIEGQVRRMMLHDPRFQAIRRSQKGR